MGNSDTCRDQRCLTACQKQYKQNESAVDVATGVEVHVTGDPGHV